MIKQAVKEFPICMQEELLNKFGHHDVIATQATISQNIHDLKVVEAPDENGASHFVLFRGKGIPETRIGEEGRLVQMIKDIVLKVE